MGSADPKRWERKPHSLEQQLHQPEENLDPAAKPFTLSQQQRMNNYNIHGQDYIKLKYRNIITL